VVELQFGRAMAQAWWVLRGGKMGLWGSSPGRWPFLGGGEAGEGRGAFMAIIEEGPQCHRLLED
jgi:hypothetical protein